MIVVEFEYELVFDYEFEGVVFDYEVWFEFDDIDEWEKDKSILKRSVRVGDIIVCYFLFIVGKGVFCVLSFVC